MNITIQSSKLVKPKYNINPPDTSHQVIPLSVFDNVTETYNVAVIYAFNPPTPSNIDIEKGLSKVLAEYRVCAGRLGEDEEGNLVFVLNDQGVRFVEATVDDTELRDVLPASPTKEFRKLHPSVEGIKELLQVQLTRFPCGSLVVGFTSHHQLADGYAISNFLVAWGLATRGLAIDPIPLHARKTLFKHRDPPSIQYNHGEIEYISDETKYLETFITINDRSDGKDIVVHKVHLTSEFISELRASTEITKPYNRFVIVCAHLWRAITKAWGLQNHVTTEICISVDGRTRMDPKVPSEYFGNLVLWAFPRTKVGDLINQPISYASELISSEVEKVNDSYFQSFVDFASSDTITKEGYISFGSINKPDLCPKLDVSSWLRLPFFDLDFGCGKPYHFTPSYIPAEGHVVLLPYLGDGSVEAIVTLFSDRVDAFEKCCYSLD